MISCKILTDDFSKSFCTTVDTGHYFGHFLRRFVWKITYRSPIELELGSFFKCKRQNWLFCHLLDVSSIENSCSAVTAALSSLACVSRLQGHQLQLGHGELLQGEVHRDCCHRQHNNITWWQSCWNMYLVTQSKKSFRSKMTTHKISVTFNHRKYSFKKFKEIFFEE